MSRAASVDYGDGRLWPLSASGTIVLLIALMLTAIGVFSIYVSESGSNPSLAVTKRQAIYSVVAIATMIAAFRVRPGTLRDFAYPFFGVILVFLAILLLAHVVSLEPLVTMRRKTARWIEFGPMRFQPSEFAKIAYVLALANYLKFRSNYRTISGLVPPLLITFIPLTLILKEPDLGTSMLFLPVLFIMLFVAGARIRHLAIIMLLGLATMPLYYFSPLMSDYQRQRIEVLLKQNSTDPRWQRSQGFQLQQSKTAIGSGKFFGRDDEEGDNFFRHNLLPEEHNDFIFAVIGHRFGLIGTLATVLVYLVFLIAALVAASATNDPFSRLVAVGLAAMIGVQALFNIGMTIGVAPITGLTLPFVSSGGSSLIANFLAVGLLLCVSRHRPVMIAPRPFEFMDDHYED